MSWKDESPVYHPDFADTIVPSNRTFPFYYNEHPSILPGVTDKTLSVISPLVAYWALSLVFHALDTWGANSAWLARYRIHESPEVRSKNLVSKWHVVGAVLLQQAIQTLLGVFWVDAEDSALTDHTAKMSRMSPILVQSTLLWTGNPHQALSHLQAWGSIVLHFIYWWAIPTFQIFFAFFVLDTWQYFLHRLFHTNKFLYRHLHSWHHRLYVPYAFGALYNHPIEGLLLDTVGAVVAQHLALLSLRQATFLFTFSTLKTVDDHCGYSLPFDPFQFFFSNNADYHDIHHQAIGIKKNFSQPFFVHWDVVMGTRMTRKDVEDKLKKARANGVLKENGVHHINGNGLHANGNGVYTNGNGHHANGNGVANGDLHKEKVE